LAPREKGDGLCLGERIVGVRGKRDPAAHGGHHQKRGSRRGEILQPSDEKLPRRERGRDWKSNGCIYGEEGIGSPYRSEFRPPVWGPEKKKKNND